MNVNKGRSETHYYKRKHEETLSSTDNKQKEFYSELRYIFIFNDYKTTRADLIKVLRKYKSNISLSSMIKSINDIKAKESENINGLGYGYEKREQMNKYIGNIITQLKRDWEIKKILNQ